MMSDYAIVQDSFVINTVEWDGNGNIFDGYITFEVDSGNAASIGDAYINSTLYPKPRDGYDYDFDNEKLEWVITAEGATQKAKLQAEINLAIAQSEYDRASDKIDAFDDQIEDEDYTATDTEAVVKSNRSAWITYRKSLRAYISAADGTVTLPIAPDA